MADETPDSIQRWTAKRRVGEISGVPQRLSDRTYTTMSCSS